MKRLIRHSAEELREGLRTGATGDNLSPAFESVREELWMAGFLRDGRWLTLAGRRFLDSGPGRRRPGARPRTCRSPVRPLP
jgi:hypothetical protein